MTSIRISVLGSTGSIGTQVLDVVDRLGSDKVRVVALGAQSNAELLIEQTKKYLPDFVCIGDVLKHDAIKSALNNIYGFHSQKPIKVLCGKQGFDEIASIDYVDKVVMSIAGTPGLSPTIKAIKAGKDVALASKEVLVAAGHIVMELARQNKVNILPIDSEHSAIFQCLNGENPKTVEKIYLTASGGAFRDKSIEELSSVTAEQALNHPTWKMGKKVTVDSATLMNKGLEIIEAKWLFGLDAEQIEVLIHHQSIIHSMVGYNDGSIIAQLGLPDMRLPIQYSLLYPQRINTALPRLNLAEIGKLTFSQVDYSKFECLSLAKEAASVGGTLPVVMNAADEVAVDMFLNNKIGFLDIAKVVGKAMHSHKSIPNPALEEIISIDKETRLTIRE